MFNLDDQFEQALTAAARAAENGHYKLAALHQQQAIALLRQALAAQPNRDTHSRLSIELYNLAMYQAEQKLWSESVAALMETVEIDQQLELPDLESDQDALAAARFKLMSTAVTQAETAATQEKFLLATHYQETAVHTLKAMFDLHNHPKILGDLAIQLFNLAGYYGRVGRHEEAVTALEEVVTIDQQLNLPDLVNDQAVLEEARLGAAIASSDLGQTLIAELKTLSPAELADFSRDLQQFNNKVSHLPPAEQQQLQQLMKQLAQRTANMSPAEQKEMAEYVGRITAEQSFFNPADRPALDQHLFDLAQSTAGFTHLSPEQQLHQLQEISIDYLVHEIHEGVWAWQAGDISADQLPEMIATLQELAPNIAQDNSFGPYKQDLAQYILAITLYLNGNPQPPIPHTFKDLFAQLQNPHANP